MAEAKKPAPAAEAPSAGGSGKKNTVLFIVIGLLVLVILIGGGLAAWLVLTIQANQNFGEPVATAEHGAEEEGHGDEAKKKKKKKKEKDGEHAAAPVFDKLDVFTVNLQGGTVLQTEIHVQVADEKQKDFVKGYLPRISSQVNLLLSSKKPEEVSTMEQKMKLMEEIKQTINKVLDAKEEEEGVMSVEFKTFIVQ